MKKRSTNYFFRLNVLAMAFIAFCPTSLNAKEPKGKKPPATTDRRFVIIDSIIQHYVNQGNFNGVVSIGEKRKLVYNKAYGLGSRELNVKNDTNTKFEIGSVSKQFCAVLTMIAEAEGKVVLDSPISAYLKYTAEAQSGLGGVTLHQLLAMRSGIPSYDNFPNFVYGVGRRNWTHQEFIMDQCGYPLAPPPGTTFAYSDGNYYILGAMLEKIYGKKYDVLLQEKLFTPLGMKNSGFLTGTGFPNGGDIVENLNDGYVPITNVYDPNTNLPIASKYQNALWLNMSDVAYASGAIYMTGSDFIKWAFALEDNTLRIKDLHKQMFTPYSNRDVLTNYYPSKKGTTKCPPDPNTYYCQDCKPTGYGYGMVIVERPPLPGSTTPVTIYTHGGLTPGYSSVGAMVKDHGISIFISSNINTDAPLFMCWQIMNTLMGVAPNYGCIP